MERYDTRGYKCGGPSNNDCMEKDPEGNYVLYSDAQAVERELAMKQDDWLKECQENDRLRAALAAAQGEITELVEMLKAEGEEMLFWRHQARDREKEMGRLSGLYHDLLLCVSKKFPDEPRHETAKRYILERERASEMSGPKAAADTLIGGKP